MNIEELILKILEQKNDSDIEEIKVDLNRVCMQGFGSDQFDIGYIDYLYKHYNNEIQTIRSVPIGVGSNLINRQISRVEDIRNNFKDNQKSLQNDFFEYEQYLIENKNCNNKNL